jgi:DNA repair exonuclease SbcCD ATPase subunit
MNLRSKLDKLLLEYSLVSKQVKEERKSLQEAKTYLDEVTQAQKLTQSVAEYVQEQAHKQISRIVTKCLQTIFGDEAYEFRINFSQKRSKTEAELVLVRDSQEVDPTEASGGGVVDLVSFALRLACLVLSTPKKRKLLVLDEPMKHLSSEYRPAVKEMLEGLSKELGIQIIMVTHSTELVAGKVIEL